ncbi:MAG: FprA family A-type flavoprotein [Bacteroidaceae bacterium]|nr:FprA family A-type flavoprotein [Bacteroidaceae bacterium]
MEKNITPTIRYIGVDDPDLDLFESQYDVPEGMCYNSYLIDDDKLCVMDGVDGRKVDEWMKNLQEALAGRQPSYLVVSHMEPDHGAGVKAFVEAFPEAKLVGNAKTFALMSQFFDFDVDSRKVVVGAGDTLPLGHHTLTFIMAPMVHWPEVMVSFEQEEGVLFSADAFGKFGVIDADPDDWACEGRRYYFNIVGKYGANVQSLLKKLAPLPIRIICPLHGPVLSENLAEYISLYDTWSSYRPETKGVAVFCASIHGNTMQAAEALERMLKEKGVERVSLVDLTRSDIAEAVEDAFRFDRMVLCASSYDAGVFTPMAQFLYRLKSKNFQSRKVGIVENGSWAPSAARTMLAALEEMKNITIVGETVTLRSAYKPERDDEALLALAEAMKDE